MQLLDAKAVLGLGMHRQDCGAACTTSGAPGIYFACGPGGCATTALPLEQQVGDPVPAFERNNNGVLIVLPQVSLGGSAQLEGALVFGIGTQANIQVGTAKVFDVDTGGNFSTATRARRTARSWTRAPTRCTSPTPTCPAAAPTSALSS
jgi:hypothetical protein